MPTNTWTKSGTSFNGNWTDASHWSNDQVPAAGDTDALDDLGHAYTVTVNASTNEVSSLTIDSTSATLAVASGGTLSAGDITISAGELTIASGGAVDAIGDITVSSGGAIVLTKGSTLSASTIDLSSGATLSGAGTVFLAGAGITGGGTVEASGTLDIEGTIASGIALVIDSSKASDLLIGGTAEADAAIGISSTKQTLEIGASGHLTIDGLESVTSGAIVLDGGSLTDTSGLYLASSASLSGVGTVNADLDGDGSGTVMATGGTLDVTGSVTSNVSLAISNTSNSDLKIDGVAVQSAAIKISNTNETLEIGSAGSLTIGAAESVTNGTITLDGAGATLIVTGGLTLGNNATLTGAGVIASSIVGANANPGTVIASGGTLDFQGSVDASGKSNVFEIAPGGTLAFASSVGTAGKSGIDPGITFEGSGGTLDLTGEGRGSATGEPTKFFGVVSGFVQGDKILVAESGTGDSLIYTSTGASSGVLSVVNDGIVEENISLAGSYTAGQFAIAASGGIDTITICFMAGTLVRTPVGEVPVETLKRGDLVETADGCAVPVTWLGRQTVSTRFTDPLRVLPIRIAAGALDAGVPSRDLLLSPDHAVLIDGVLIQAGALVNGTSIRRENDVPEVFTYYHVETDDHALILVENTPAETFIDNVERLNFDNWAEHQELYPHGKAIMELSYPRAKAHRQVSKATRARLAARAAA